MRRPVELAYLLARAADTVADRGELPADRRREGLARLRRALATGEPPRGLPVPHLAGGEPTAEAERHLLDRLPALYGRLAALEPADRADVTAVCDRLLATMESELEFFAAATPEHVVALPDAAALMAYTDGIAGCVGTFWTALCDRHAVALPPARRRVLAIEGRRYGRGLQLVNVLRDIVEDARRGRVYLPGDELREAGIDPASLAAGEGGPALARVAARWRSRSRRGLRAGLVYASRLPVRPLGVRIATALPAAIGLETLALLEGARGAFAEPVRIGRQRLRRTIVRSVLACLAPGGPRRLAARGRAPV